MAEEIHVFNITSLIYLLAFQLFQTDEAFTVDGHKHTHTTSVIPKYYNIWKYLRLSFTKLNCYQCTLSLPSFPYSLLMFAWGREGCIGNKWVKSMWKLICIRYLKKKATKDKYENYLENIAILFHQCNTFVSLVAEVLII